MAVAVKKLINKNNWLMPQDEEEEKWLARGELCADVLRDFRTDKNAWSVFILPDNSAISAERVGISLCAGTDRPDKVDYVTFDSGLLAAIGCHVETCPGKTVDAQVNELHADVCFLTIGKVVELARLIKQHGSMLRVADQKVGQEINRGITAGLIDIERLSAKMKGYLQEARYTPAQ